MVTVSSPPPQLSSSSPAPGEEEVSVRRMDDLLEKLKKNMVDLILQGDDVTRQMWHMYSVFEEIFGHPSSSTGDRTLKKVVVGDRIKKAAAEKKPTPTTTPTTTITSNTTAESASPLPTLAALPAAATTTPEVTESGNASLSPRNHKVFSPVGAISPSVRGSSPSSDRPSDASSAQSDRTTTPTPHRPIVDAGRPTSNPLLDTIGALAASNADSDDSDLDIVYQQLRCRGRHRRTEQVRGRTHRTAQHRHQHQVAGSSDPESIGYAGSNSIDSGYKSLCATPEVSDSVVRRSASDVSASDSSTASGGGKAGKIKMGTRSVAGSKARHAALDDVALDHLMYLRQSLGKEAQRSPSDSIPSSVTSGSYRDSSDLSPRAEEWREGGVRYPPYRGATSSSSPESFARVEQEGGGESSSDFLLSGVEYYDLESIQEFPPPASSSYVAMLEEKTRRFRLISAPKCADPLSERHLSSLYRKRNDGPQSGGGLSRSSAYGPTPKALSSSSSSRHHRPHHATDSKLTEAAIRVLEMIEDFRVGETQRRAIPYREPPPPEAAAYRHHAPPPRYRKHARPASTGSLLEHEMDARSVASASSYAEHHVYEEIMYDLVRDRPPPPPAVRSRLLPVPPPRSSPHHHHQHPQQQVYAVDPRRMVVRSSHKQQQQQQRSHMYSMVHARGDRFLEMEWHRQDRRDSHPDFPV